MSIPELRGVRAGYGDIEVLHGADMYINGGKIVTLIDSNGAGRTTTMRTICGILSPSHGEVIYRDEAIYSKASHEIAGHGIMQVPENRDLFANMTVIDNLLLSAQTEETKVHREENLDEMLELFPRLAEHRSQRAGTMSGGEQQVPTLVRALMDKPDLLILDEPSIGFAPHLVQGVFNVIEDIHAQGMTVLMVEQNVQQTLKLADYDYAMENGYISMTADGDQLLGDEGVVEAYLGM